MTNLTYQIRETLTPTQIARIDLASACNHINQALPLFTTALQDLWEQLVGTVSAISDTLAPALESTKSDYTLGAPRD